MRSEWGCNRQRHLPRDQTTCYDKHGQHDKQDTNKYSHGIH